MDTKEALTFELRELLGQWHSLGLTLGATAESYAVLGERIREVCRRLDSLDTTHSEVE